MADMCMWTDSSRCNPCHITLAMLSRVIWLGSQLEESFLTHLSTIWFSLSPSFSLYFIEQELNDRFHDTQCKQLTTRLVKMAAAEGRFNYLLCVLYHRQMCCGLVHVEAKYLK